MALAPKSNAMETAYMDAKEDAMKQLAEPVPMNIRNAPTRLMKDQGYGEGYKYAHDYEGHITDMECLPDSLKGKTYYHPSDQGLEVRYGQRLEQIKKWKEEQRKKR